MSGFSFFFVSLILPALTILFGALEIIVAVLLLREEGPGPKIMLAGAITSLLGNLAGVASMLMLNQSVNFGEAVYIAMSALTALGSLLFIGGLLLHALKRRALTRRIAELEAILASRIPG
ncbi:MAG: hypothetical protein EOP87_03730 [Verrucomicrobiaceae bacterium]|nr:MAG: hypothetical protein EOP87_03730 [Verrucomicrobiaceae bacterium]